MFKIILILLGLAGFSSAATITSPGGGLDGTEQWGSGASLSSTVTFDAGLYKYEYTWSEPDKQISHIILELCLSLAADQVAELLDEVYGSDAGSSAIATYTSSSNSNSNPGLIGSLHGLKIDFINDPNTTTFGFITPLAPVTGRVYAKSGRAGGPGGGGWVYANGSGVDVPGCKTCPPDLDNPSQVPEPSTMALMGAALIGAGLLRIRRKDSPYTHSAAPREGRQR